MGQLNITKVAVGCASLDVLESRMAAQSVDGIAVITTRNRPTRHTELIGGSLFWIIKHKLVARQTILAFEEVENERRWKIKLASKLIAVTPRGKRAHQGWRYLEGNDAPPDRDDTIDMAMPSEMRNDLEAIGLL